MTWKFFLMLLFVVPTFAFVQLSRISLPLTGRRHGHFQIFVDTVSHMHSDLPTSSLVMCITETQSSPQLLQDKGTGIKCDSLKRAIHHLGPDNVFVSIVEGHSTDTTAELLQELDAHLVLVVASWRILTGDETAHTICGFSETNKQNSPAESNYRTVQTDSPAPVFSCQNSIIVFTEASLDCLPDDEELISVVKTLKEFAAALNERVEKRVASQSFSMELLKRWKSDDNSDI
ncbi:hypothetical protein EV702DRAFT_1049003 [Suillus placidus]|uniref:Uncharacterized protein n=1 Tax=Suillus placidus TaxID=48579 RepID=A0A9P6ZM56_9AGAM|nr:hypothetical protein EV702DRAFT_1049003 [Suillus placidus]